MTSETAITLLLVLVIGCARPTQTPKELPDREGVQALAVEELGRTHVYRARYNPPLCPCPAFEVEVGRQWIRVALADHDEDRPVSLSLTRFAEERRGEEDQPLFLIGTLESDRIQYSATGLPVMEFVLEGFTETFPAAAVKPTPEAQDE